MIMIYLSIECSNCSNIYKRVYWNRRSVDTIIRHALSNGWTRVYYDSNEKLFCPECSNLPQVKRFYRNERRQQNN